MNKGIVKQLENTMEKRKRKLKVFEAFAGIGAQASALKRLNIEYEIGLLMQ